MKGHIKRVLRVVGIVVLVCVACCAGAWGYLCTSNLRNAKTVGDIPAPVGYTRVFENTSIEKDTRGGESYAKFLRELPLKRRGTKVRLFNGRRARLQFLSAAVIDMPLLSNSEQCADMTMRLRAEYLFSKGRYSEIRFRNVNGEVLQYHGGGSRKALEKFLRNAYGVCSTYSVYKETKPRKISEVQPGDVLVYPVRKGRKYGHALIVVDVARRGDKVAVMCAEGNTPARDAHIVRNYNPFRNPWTIFDSDDEVLRVGVFHFNKDELRHY